MKHLFFKFLGWLFVNSFTEQSYTLRNKALNYIKYHSGNGFSLIDKTYPNYVTTDAFYALPVVNLTIPDATEDEIFAITDITVDNFGNVWYIGEGWETGYKYKYRVLNMLTIEQLCSIAERIRQGKIYRN